MNISNISKNEIIDSIGIDLGTTNTVVSFFTSEGNISELKVNNASAIPSAIFFEEEGLCYFGSNAIKRARKNSQSLVRLFKRSIGDPKQKFNVIYNKSKQDESANNGVYVIDTNCLVDCPDLFIYFKKGEKVILPITVTEELRFRSKKAETQYTAQKALENLDNAPNKYKCDILFEESDTSLLPTDFFAPTSQNDENDDKVLSIAIRHREEGVKLITSDNKLGRIKAKQCDIESIKLKDFRLDRLPEVQQNEGSFSISGEQATTYFLRYIKDVACETLGCDGVNAVITVPDNFNNIQVEATKRAARDAGLRDVYIAKEPVAAAIAYSLTQDSDQKILVYDFGGGTFDVAIVNYNKSKNEFETLSTDGNPKLGGQDITDEFVKYIYEILEDESELVMYSLEESGLPQDEYYANVLTIESEVERAKKSLSTVDEETIGLVNLYTPDGRGLSKQIKVTRKEFEDVVADIIRQPTPCIERAIIEAGITAEQIDAVILSGGTSLMPIVREKVQNFFGRLPLANKNPATLISNGAAIIARSQFHSTPEMCDKDSSKPDTPKNQATNIKRKAKVVADIGIATDDYNFDCLIPHGTQLPATGIREYYLMKDNQDTVEIKVYSRKKTNPTVKASRCDYIDKISITNLPQLNKDSTKVYVEFTLTEEYELSIQAQIKNNAGETIVDSQSITVDRESVR